VHIQFFLNNFNCFKAYSPSLSLSTSNIRLSHVLQKKLDFDTLDVRPVYGYSGQVELAKDYSHSVKPWLPFLEQNGVETYVATRSSIAGSGLSQIIHKELKLIPYVLASDMLIQSSKALKQQSPTLLIMYYSGIDTLAHRYGPYSEE
jgi:hypothetical protein